MQFSNCFLRNILLDTILFPENDPSFVSTFRESNESESFNALECIGNLPHTTNHKKETKSSIEHCSLEKTTKFNPSPKEEIKSRRATESIAERARKISRSKITKLKKTLSMDDIMRHVSGVNNIGFDSDSTDADISLE